MAGSWLSAGSWGKGRGLDLCLRLLLGPREEAKSRMIKERTELTLPSSPHRASLLSAFGRGKGVGVNFLNQPVTPAPAQQRPLGLPLSPGRTLYRALVYPHPTPFHTSIGYSHSKQVQLSVVGLCSQKTPLFHKRERVRHMVQANISSLLPES